MMGTKMMEMAAQETVRQLLTRPGHTTPQETTKAFVFQTPTMRHSLLTTLKTGCDCKHKTLVSAIQNTVSTGVVFKQQGTMPGCLRDSLDRHVAMEL